MGTNGEGSRPLSTIGPQEPRAASPADAKTAGARRAGRLRTMRILVADDDAQTRELLADFLRQEGHRVDVAGQGREALDRLRTGAYEVAFLDARLRGTSGMDVLRVARDDAPGTACVLITGLADVGTAVEAMREGAADFVAKPIEPDAIDRVLENVKAETRLPRREPPGPRRGRAEPDLDVRAVFLTNRAGLLLASRVVPEEAMVDEDLFGAALDVIQKFMHTAFPVLGGRWLTSIRSGNRTLVLEPGQWALLTVLVRGAETEELHRRMRDALREFEARNRERLGPGAVSPDDLLGTEDVLERFVPRSGLEEGPEGRTPPPPPQT